MLINTHSGEVSSKETLLDAGPEGEGDDQQLLLPDHVPEGGHQQLQPRQLLLVLLLVRDSKLMERVNEESNEDGSCDGAGQVDASHDVDLADVRGKVPVGDVLHLPLCRGIEETSKRGSNEGLVSDGVRDRSLRAETAATPSHLLVRQLNVGGRAGREDGRADDVPEDGVALEEEEEDAEKLDNYRFGI